MKWIILLILFAVLIVIIATRFRRQIVAVIEIFKMFRQVRQQMKPKEEKQIKPKVLNKDAPLVRCAKCGQWVSESNALNLRSKTFYCSTNCMEQAVRV
jgi:Sec-independent protein translocase protein TatA